MISRTAACSCGQLHLTIEGEPARPADVVRIVGEQLQPGDVARLTIVRGSKRLVVPVRLTERPTR